MQGFLKKLWMLLVYGRTELVCPWCGQELVSKGNKPGDIRLACPTNLQEPAPEKPCWWYMGRSGWDAARTIDEYRELRAEKENA